ncbi:MAG: 50S ribosomal protein L30e [Candidatus Methanolliviera hydrocarbonicum]|jgi:Ribosomal protein L30E|uniref:Large ribosomal subunit protein eL30 n=1 Tax=Candidatus Methanolliviera hydrocarbonicum TaxID=2491085 RepID=A0A520KXI4_9EURY|nr:MAG: 50S ribosomal protein L30e [Candidatus Methanolliviera hydrocarbonicum]
MMDIGKSLRTAVKTGKVQFGSRQTLKSLKEREAELIILARNCPYNYRREIEEKSEDVLIYPFDGNGKDLGILCGKSFIISSLSIADEGESDIISLLSNPK